MLGAAVDVFSVEPKSNSEEFTSPLREFDNVILTPRLGGSTVVAQKNIGFEVAQKLVKYSDDGSTITSVNFPEVALPSHTDKHRLLHIHANVPGVLSRINRVFSDKGISTSGQYLQANDKVGYVVIDIDVEHRELALTKLQQLRDDALSGAVLIGCWNRRAGLRGWVERYLAVGYCADVGGFTVRL